MFNIICVKFGKKYSSDFVNKLHMDLLSYNPLNPFKFHCYTDDPEGINNSINIINPIGPTLKGVWNKLALFSEEFPIRDENIYLDLDVCISNDITSWAGYFDWDKLSIVHAPWKDNKKRYGRLSSYDVIHHSSVMVWQNNVHHIWEHFNSGLRDYYMRKYVGIDRFLAHEDIEVAYLPNNFTMSKKYQKREQYEFTPAILTYEEIDVQISDLLPCD